MGKSGQSGETTDQKHKRHNSKSAKLKKRHEMKKQKRKIKEERSKGKLMKKEKEKLKKLKIASEQFANKVSSEDIYTVKKIIQKLIQHNNEALKELPQLFEMLDDGYNIDLMNLTDSYVMQKLNKVFKLLKLERQKDNKLEFKKKEKIHDFKLKVMIQHFIDDITSAMKNDSGSDGSGSESDDERSINKRKRSRSRSRDSKQSNSSESDESYFSDDSYQQKKNQKKVQPKEEIKTQIKEIPKQYNIRNSGSESDDEEDEEVGPKFEGDVEAAGKEFLESTMGLIKKGDNEQIAPSKEIEDEINRLFAGGGKKSKKEEQEQQLSGKTKYLGHIEKKLTEEQEQMRQVAIKDYLEEYNSHFRKKTLMEEHMNKKKEKLGKDTRSKDEKLHDMMKRPFDHERDIKYSQIDSSKAFKVMNKNNLDKRFAPSSSSYL